MSEFIIRMKVKFKTWYQNDSLNIMKNEQVSTQKEMRLFNSRPDSTHQKEMIIRWVPPIVKILLVPSDVNDIISMLVTSESIEALASSEAFGADHFSGQKPTFDKVSISLNPTLYSSVLFERSLLYASISID